MLWVGGGIILHGLEFFGLSAPYHWVHGAGLAVGGGFIGWVVEAALSGVVGLAVGVAVIPVLSRLLGKGH